MEACALYALYMQKQFESDLKKSLVFNQAVEMKYSFKKYGIIKQDSLRSAPFVSLF